MISGSGSIIHSWWFSEVKQRSNVNVDMLTLAFTHTNFSPHSFAKEVNCVLVTVILRSLVICHRNHPSCKINFPPKTCAMKGYKLTLILTSLALRIQRSFWLVYPPPAPPSNIPLIFFFSLSFDPSPLDPMHHRRAGILVIECDNKSKLYSRKVLSFV